MVSAIGKLQKKVTLQVQKMTNSYLIVHAIMGDRSNVGPQLQQSLLSVVGEVQVRQSAQHVLFLFKVYLSYIIKG